MILKNLLSKASGMYPGFVCGLLFLGIVVPGTVSSVSYAESSEVVDRIVAVVNDDIVVLQEINQLIQPMQLQIQTSGLSEEQIQSTLLELRQNVINQLVNQKLINQAAQEYEITVSEDEVNASVERIKSANQFSDTQLGEALKTQGLTMEKFREQLREQILSSTLENYEVQSRIVITKADVEAYYNQHPDEYKGQVTYHLRNILIKSTRSGNPADMAAAENKIAQVFADLEAGKLFEDLARRYSESPFASEGGELGNFKLDDLSPNLKAAVAPLSPGEATEALETSEGYQILFVQDIMQEPDTPLDTVYEEIEAKLYEEQYKDKRETWIKSLREKAHIRIIQ